jgi:hypothetical protein
MPKVGRWLQQHWILVQSPREADEPERLYLDQNGHACDELYEAAFYESEDEAKAAIANKKAKGTFVASPLEYHLRAKTAKSSNV